MSWNTSRILNNIAYKTADIVETNENGTVFDKKIYCDGVVINDYSGPAAYLLSDGTFAVSSSTGQPNIYLYTNSNASLGPVPAAGQIRANSANNETATILYISHITDNNIDIEVFLQELGTTSLVYLQDKNSSVNYVRFKVTAAITVVANSYVSIPVEYLNGGGTGQSDLGNGAAIFMSIFDNSALIDSRLTSLELKTQHQVANSTFTLFDANINMNENRITALAYPVNPDDATSMSYVTTVMNNYAPLQDFNDLTEVVGTNSSDIDVLEGKTIHINATASTNTISNSTTLILDEFGNFIVRDNALNPLLAVSQAEVDIHKTLNLNTNRITGVTGPSANSDAVNKLYVDNQLGSYTPLTDFNDLQSTVNTNSADIESLIENTQAITWLSGVSKINGNLNIALPPSNFFAIRSGDLMNNYMVLTSIQADFYKKINMNANAIENVSGVRVSGYDNSNFFVKSNGSIDENQYLTSTDDIITTLQSKTTNLSYNSSTNVTTLNNSVNVLLNTGQVFGIRKNDLSANYLTILPTQINSYLNISMNSNRILSLADPTASTDAASKNYVDTQDALKLNLSGGTLTGSLNMGTNNITNIASIAASNLTLSSVNAYGIPYFDASKGLQSASKDFFIISNIQTQINSATVGSVIRLATGNFTESIICSGQNYTICGAPCPLYSQTTQVTGNVQIGATTPASTQTRVRLKDIKFIGSLSFVSNSSFQELRTHIDNCDFNGTITFPTTTATVAGGTQIYFTNCSFSGTNNPLCVIPNQALYTIYFTRCTFASQPITNNLTVGNFSRLIFSDCGTLPSLSLGNCVLNGLNGTASVTNVATGSLTLGGTTSQFLLGNGSTISNTAYTTITVQAANWVYNGVNIAFHARRVGVANNAIVTIFIGGFSATAATTTSTLISSSVLGATFRPINAVFFPCRIQKAGVTQLGCCIIYSSGEIGFTDIAQTTNFWTSGQTGCGLSGDFAVSFPTNG